jgi:predicted metal-dependent peptidase
MAGHNVSVIIDTSGSMAQSDLALALGVIGNALRSLPDPRGLRVLAGDTAVACAKNIFRPEQIELSGGGGTAMDRLIVAAAEERPAPKAILVVTDGYTGYTEGLDLTRAKTRLLLRETHQGKRRARLITA